MKKETLIAVVLGIGTGVIIAILIIINSHKSNTANSTTLPETTTITPAITFEPKKQEPLLIVSPKDLSTTTSTQITITGKAPKNSVLLIQSAGSESVIKTTSSEFSVKFGLNMGENHIKITQYLEKTTDARELTVYRIN